MVASNRTQRVAARLRPLADWLTRMARLIGTQFSRLLLIAPVRTAMIAVAVFVIDCLSPLWIAAGAFYMAAVLSAVPIRHRRAVYITAGACSGLLLLGWIVSPMQWQAEWWQVLINRLLDLGIIWAAAAMADSWNRMQQRRLQQMQEARLLHQVTTLSSSRLSVRKALENSVETLCEILGWAVGHVYVRDTERQRLVSSDIWWTAEDRFDLLRAAARDLQFKPGEGVPGRICLAGEPIVVADVTESPDYAWLKDAELLGVRGAFALPISVDGQVGAVMEFFSTQPIAVEREFFSLAQSLGQQLGRLFERQQADRNLRQSEERLRLALEGGGMGTWEWHIATGRVAWSPEIERIHGLEPGAFAGTWEAVQAEVHPEDRQRFQETVARALAEGGDYRVEYRIALADGTIRWLEGRGALHADSNGQPQRMVGVCMDVSERKDAEVRNARLAAIVQSSDDAILAKSLEGVVLSWNGGAERIYGYTADEMVGRPITALFPEGSQEDIRGVMARIARGERVDHYETVRRRKDGRLITLSLSISPIVDAQGTVIAASSVGRDVTEKKRAEQEMKDAREKAETANRLRSRFLANMSHELRTPMNSILGMLQLAMKENVPGEVRGWLATANASAESLLLLLNDLLDFSKIEAGRLDIQPAPFRLRGLLEETARALGGPAFAKGVELLVDIAGDVPDCVVGDAGRLRQVLTNLLTNGVKFTEEGEVVLAASLEALRGATAVVRFSVSDTGLGIAAEDQRRIFEPFIQSDATASRRQGGAGLGLSIACELVRRMGGEIELASEPGEGSCFWFSLPLPIAETTLDDEGDVESRPRATPEMAERLEGLRVLIVDANAASRAILQRTLEHWSMRPEVAIDADHAMGKLQRAADDRQAYHLVIADAATFARAGATPVERLLETAEPPTLVWLRRLGDRNGHGADDGRVCVEKPISPDRLLAAMVQALGVAPDAAAMGSSHRAAAPAERPLAVLLAEDTLANQEVARCALERRGHAVCIVRNGEEAVQRLAEQTFDVVLMDVTMPVMDGYEAAAAIRRREAGQGRHLPIVAMTAHAAPEDRARCLAAGMDAHLPKPIDLAKLVALVEALAAASPNGTPPSGAPPSGTQSNGSQPNGSLAACSDAATHGLATNHEPAEADAQVVDHGGTMERLGGDCDLLCKIIALFDEDMPPLVQAAQDAASEGHAARLQHAAHSLKGLAANFGARAAVAAAARLEEMAKTGQIADAAPVVKELQRELARLDAALTAYRRQPLAEPAVGA